MNATEDREILLGADENSVLQYLKNYPGNFITEMEIARHADGGSRLLQDKYWVHGALVRLLDLHLVDTDGFGRYLIHSSDALAACARKKFLAPQVRDILEHSDQPLDLSRFG